MFVDTTELSVDPANVSAVPPAIDLILMTASRCTFRYPPLAIHGFCSINLQCKMCRVAV